MSALADPPAARLSAPPGGPGVSTGPPPYEFDDGDDFAGFPSPEHLADRGMPPDGTPLTGEQFLALPFAGVRAEWVDGRISYLPMNLDPHQAIQMFLILALDRHARGNGLTPAIRSAGTGMGVPRGYNEPDVTFLIDRDDPRRRRAVWAGADVVFEIVSADDPARDRVRKRADYGDANIGEYWIVDPRARFREVLVLTRGGDGAWNEHVFAEGETATGAVLDGFAVDVAACLNGD